MKLVDALMKGDERLDGTCTGELLSSIDGKVVGCALGAIAVGMLTDREWDEAQANAQRIVAANDFDYGTELQYQVENIIGDDAYSLVRHGVPSHVDVAPAAFGLDPDNVYHDDDVTVEEYLNTPQAYNADDAVFMFNDGKLSDGGNRLKVKEFVEAIGLADVELTR